MTDEHYLNISPIDGRYRNTTKPLQQFFSEFAFFRYRLMVEIEYFTALHRIPLPQLENLTDNQLDQLKQLVAQFNKNDYETIKHHEQQTRHDVKALEYYLKEKFDSLSLRNVREFVHFGLTSQDVNSTAFALMVGDATHQVMIPALEELLHILTDYANAWGKISMLARTHGQPASPTTLGKEILVFAQRLLEQLTQLKKHQFTTKFGGATGNLNAHYAAYPHIDWHSFAENFVQQLGLKRTYPTTQIEPYDNFAQYCHILIRINNILTDLCRDMWMYIMLEYFTQHIEPGQVGSSAMPHKVNPIDFENAEGNLGVANALLEHFAAKLPISRLQRDLSDSTVTRNAGVALAHSLIAYQSIIRGLKRIIPNNDQILNDLRSNPQVIAEAIQTILRREGYEKPYETMKKLTQSKKITLSEIHDFINSLELPENVKNELKSITPEQYIGKP